MTVLVNENHEYVDSTATATRVTSVDSAGNPSGSGVAPVQRVTSITRVNTAVTTAITAGKKSYTVTVIAASSASSPTLDGVALPAGYTASYSAPSMDTLESASVVTVAGDDVIILAVT